MLSKLRPRSVYDVFAVLALIVAVGGTSAYAANTVFSSDIADGEVRSADIRNDDIQSGDVKDGSINTFDVHSFLGVDVVDGTLTSDDIQNDSLRTADIQELHGARLVPGSVDATRLGIGSVNSDKVQNNSLTGFNIDESSLDLSSVNAAKYGFVIPQTLPSSGAFAQVATVHRLGNGAWVFWATVNTTSASPPPDWYEDRVTAATCYLRNTNTDVSLGHAAETANGPNYGSVGRSLSMNGATIINHPQGLGSVSLHCRSTGIHETVDSGQIMAIRVGAVSEGKLFP